jgi:Domain of unknown function (DUF4375)
VLGRSDDDLRRRFEAFENRKRYPVLSPSVLASIGDDSVEQAILDFVETKVGPNWKRQYKIVTALPFGIQAVYTTFFLDAEVRNGGFNQYFWNSTGQFAIEALEGLRFFGATDHARLFEGAIQTYVREAPFLKRFRMRNTLKSFSASYKATSLTEFDPPWYRLPPLSPLRVSRIRAEPSLFSAR